MYIYEPTIPPVPHHFSSRFHTKRPPEPPRFWKKPQRCCWVKGIGDSDRETTAGKGEFGVVYQLQVPDVREVDSNIKCGIGGNIWVLHLPHSCLLCRLKYCTAWWCVLCVESWFFSQGVACLLFNPKNCSHLSTVLTLPSNSVNVGRGAILLIVTTNVLMEIRVDIMNGWDWGKSWLWRREVVDESQSCEQYLWVIGIVYAILLVVNILAAGSTSTVASVWSAAQFSFKAWEGVIVTQHP